MTTGGYHRQLIVADGNDAILHRHYRPAVVGKGEDIVTPAQVCRRVLAGDIGYARHRGLA